MISIAPQFAAGAGWPTPGWNPYLASASPLAFTSQVNPFQASQAYQAFPQAGIGGQWSAMALGSGMVQPRVDVFETSSDVVVACELPSINPNDMHLMVTDDSVTISANAFWATGTPSSFYRAVSLPTTVHAEYATATYSNGVLEVRCPKSDLASRRRLRVNVSR
jgi:HSP20 family protein